MFVTKQDDPDLEAAAVAMVKFFTSNEAQALALDMEGMVPASADVEISDEILEKYPILGEFLTAAAECENRASTLTGNMVPGLEDVWDNELPNLASGASSPEDFCQVLTDFATANPAQ
jgi:raffinose/stachyose/melibiose transport system substrate-binding protein